MVDSKAQPGHTRLSLRDFQHVAKVLHDTDAPKATVDGFADWLLRCNDRFNRAAFLEAVEVGEYKGKATKRPGKR